MARFACFMHATYSCVDSDCSRCCRSTSRLSSCVWRRSRWVRQPGQTHSQRKGEKQTRCSAAVARAAWPLTLLHLQLNDRHGLALLAQHLSRLRVPRRHVSLLLLHLRAHVPHGCAEHAASVVRGRGSAAQLEHAHAGLRAIRETAGLGLGGERLGEGLQAARVQFCDEQQRVSGAAPRDRLQLRQREHVAVLRLQLRCHLRRHSLHLRREHVSARRQRAAGLGRGHEAPEVAGHPAHERAARRSGRGGGGADLAGAEQGAQNELERGRNLAFLLSDTST